MRMRRGSKFRGRGAGGRRGGSRSRGRRRGFGRRGSAGAKRLRIGFRM